MSSSSGRPRMFWVMIVSLSSNLLRFCWFVSVLVGWWLVCLLLLCFVPNAVMFVAACLYELFSVGFGSRLSSIPLLVGS